MLDRINNDANGNPRYVCHFLALLTETEKNRRLGVNALYELALKKAKKLGGRKFHNKQFGGGIAFQSYNKQKLLDAITELQQDGETIEQETRRMIWELSDKIGAQFYNECLRLFNSGAIDNETFANRGALYRASLENLAFSYCTNNNKDYKNLKKF